MRTTLTLDEDVAAKLEAQSRRRGLPFRAIVNETLRHGLASQRSDAPRQAFAVWARDLGDLKPGLSLDNIVEPIDQMEDPVHDRSRLRAVSRDQVDKPRSQRAGDLERTYLSWQQIRRAHRQDVFG